MSFHAELIPLMLRDINEQDLLFPDNFVIMVCVSRGLGVYTCVYGVGVCVNVSKCAHEKTSAECAQ